MRRSRAPIVSAALAISAAVAAVKAQDPAAWGQNHVRQPVPAFVHGDECLFCHRDDIGPAWSRNVHNLTVRERADAPELSVVLEGQPALAPIAREVEHFLGSRHRVRFLKKDGYGRFAILTTQAALDASGPAARWIGLEAPRWDRERFADRCAGCHATGVEAAKKTFSAFGLDCYTCHGDVDLDHSKNVALAWLSRENRSDRRAVVSTCAQCHIRSGRSRSTGLPYPNNFVAGDNLFQDFAVDFAKADDGSLHAADRHILRNARDVALGLSESVTCLNCHRIHQTSTLRHRWLPRGPICFDCHDTNLMRKPLPPLTSELCEY